MGVVGRAAEGQHGRLVGRALRAPDAEVDAAGVQRLQRAELLGDVQRPVVGQQHAARADAQAVRDAATWPIMTSGAEIDTADRVVLGDPEALEAEAVDVAGERQRVVSGLPRRAAGAARCLVEDGERSH